MNATYTPGDQTAREQPGPVLTNSADPRGTGPSPRGRRAASPLAKSPVTISDVARLAGVSPGTASKALNGRGGISADTVRRVQPGRRAARLPAQRPGPRPADRPHLHGRPDHHRQLRPVQHPGHAGRRGRARPRPHLGVPVRQPGRPDPRAALPAHPAGAPGRRHHRDRPPPGPARADRPRPAGAGGLRDDPVHRPGRPVADPRRRAGRRAGRAATCSARAAPASAT